MQIVWAERIFWLVVGPVRNALGPGRLSRSDRSAFRESQKLRFASLTFADAPLHRPDEDRVR